VQSQIADILDRTESATKQMQEAIGQERVQKDSLENRKGQLQDEAASLDKVKPL
jgi:hypothetical protein